MEIKFADNLVKLQAGFIIDECWTPFLEMLFSRQTERGDKYETWEFRSLNISATVEHVYNGSQLEGDEFFKMYLEICV